MNSFSRKIIDSVTNTKNCLFGALYTFKNVIVQFHFWLKFFAARRSHRFKFRQSSVSVIVSLSSNKFFIVVFVRVLFEEKLLRSLI